MAFDTLWRRFRWEMERLWLLISFAPLFKFMVEVKDLDAAHQELTGFLRSPRVCDRTDDDLTLLLASLA